MKEICLLNESFPPEIDGVANVVQSYARVLGHQNIPVSVLTPKHPDALDSAFCFPVLRYPSVDMRKRFGYMAGVPFSFRPYTLLKERNVGLLHSHCPISSNLIARSLRVSLGVPFVMTYHTLFDIEIRKYVHQEWLQKAAVRFLLGSVSVCDEVWTVNHSTGKHLQEMGYEGDYVVMGNGVDMPKGRLPEDEIRACTKKYPLPSETPVFLYVGRLLWYKGIRVTLDALAVLSARGLDFRMVFVGDGSDEKEIKQAVQQLGLENKCFFTGSVTDRREVRAWYCRADLLLFPSVFDTSSLTIKEAAAAHTASVLIRGSCTAEGAIDRQNSFLIENDAASMAECLETLLRDRRQILYAGENAAETLYVSWDDAVMKAINRYQFVMENHAAGKYEGRKEGFFRMEAGIDRLFGAAFNRKDQS